MNSDYCVVMPASPRSLSDPGFGWVVKPGEATPIVLLEQRGKPEKLNESPNVILHFRLQLLRTMSDNNYLLAILTLAYIGVNMVMVILNFMNNNDDDCGDPGFGDVYIARCGSPVSDYVFHMTEFAATFGFAVIQAASLLYTPKTMSNIYANPATLKLVLFFNIVFSLFPTLLVWANLCVFETISHEVEYSNEITMSFIDLVLLTSLLRHRQAGLSFFGGASTIMMAAISALIAMLQIFIYNLMENGEKLAHYCEFIFEILSALILFWFCIDNKIIADAEVDEIMYGNHHDCAVCHSKSVEMKGGFGAVDDAALKGKKVKKDYGTRGPLYDDEVL